MRLLLDTHVLLWFYFGNPKLSATARAAILDPGNEKLASAASHWEIAIKVSHGKLNLNETFPDFVQHGIFDQGFHILPVEPQHTAVLIGLPHHHRDPFDRLLIAQALVEGIPIVTGDPAFALYPVARVW